MFAALSSWASAVDSFRQRLLGHTYQALDSSNVDSKRTATNRRFWSTVICVGAVIYGIGSILLVYQLFFRVPLTPEQKLLSQISQPTDSIHGQYVKYRRGPHWHGWSSVNRLIVFGDSWSTTCFVPSGARPSQENPLGNPPWPGETSTNGPNWIDYLTYDFNDSVILTANFAVGGATVDERIISSLGPHFGGLHGLRAQVQEQFTPLYVNSTLYEWQPDSSLFVIWIGINDIHEADIQQDDNTTLPIFPAIFNAYARNVDHLYQMGARNFLLMTVPPIERAPIAAGKYEIFHQAISDFNTNLTHVAWNFTTTYADTTTFLFDTHQLLDDVIDDPCIYAESCGLEETIEFCMGYSFGTKSEDPECPYPISKYLWMNPLHPTTVTHNVTARVVAEALRDSHESSRMTDGHG